jgi:hypothetical protein
MEKYYSHPSDLEAPDLAPKTSDKGELAFTGEFVSREPSRTGRC